MTGGRLTVAAYDSVWITFDLISAAERTSPGKKLPHVFFAISPTNGLIALHT